MKRNLKKSISVLLSVIMIFSVCSGMFSAVAAGKQDIPIVFVEGQSYTILDADNNQIYPDDVGIKDIISDKEKMEPIFKNLALGLATDNWDPYCDSFAAIFEEMYKELVLDNNGEATNGSHIGWTVDNPKWKSSNYQLYDYTFHYDWRLDPVYNSELLAKYVDNVLARTGKSQVVLVGRCEGAAIVSSYLAYHGDENKVNTCIMYVPSATGMDTVGAVYSGRAKFSGDSIDKYASYYLTDNDLFSETDGLSTFIATFVSILNQAKVLGLGTDAIATIYNKVYKKLIPQILSVSYGTWPGFWCMVSDEYYEDAKTFNFAGKEDEYAGLIEKLDNYHYNVQSNLEEILNGLRDKYGMKIAVIAKYGKNVYPVYEGCDVQGDGMVELSYLSFGATSSLIGTTLSDSYIEQAEAEGRGKYISPDKVVDASTCMFPDNTWIIKNLLHRDFPDSVDDLIYTIAHSADEMTVTSNESYPQFLYYNSDDESIVPMTADQTDSSNNSSWTNNPFKLFFQFFTNLFKIFTSLLKK